MELMSVGTYKDGDNEGASGKTKFHGHRHARELDGKASEEDAKEDADEHCDKVRLI